MAAITLKKLLPIGAGIVLLWLGIKYLFPVVLPFILGGAVALLAEPVAAPIAGKWNRYRKTQKYSY
jgi:predicted PurR-regulated permease PerM